MFGVSCSAFFLFTHGPLLIWDTRSQATKSEQPIVSNLSSGFPVWVRGDLLWKLKPSAAFGPQANGKQEKKTVTLPGHSLQNEGCGTLGSGALWHRSCLSSWMCSYLLEPYRVAVTGTACAWCVAGTRCYAKLSSRSFQSDFYSRSRCWICSLQFPLSLEASQLFPVIARVWQWFSIGRLYSLILEVQHCFQFREVSHFYLHVLLYKLMFPIERSLVVFFFF